MLTTQMMLQTWINGLVEPDRTKYYSSLPTIYSQQLYIVMNDIIYHLKSFKEYFISEMNNNDSFEIVSASLGKNCLLKVRLYKHDIIKRIVDRWNEPLVYHDKKYLMIVDKTKYTHKVQLSSMYGMFGK